MGSLLLWIGYGSQQMEGGRRVVRIGVMLEEYYLMIGRRMFKVSSKLQALNDWPVRLEL